MLAALFALLSQDRVEMKAYGSFYLVGKPAGYADARSWPVVIDLHAAGAGADQAAGRWRDAAAERGFFVLAPRAPGASWRPSDEAFVRACLSDAKTRFRLAPERVLLSGFSSGADLAGEVAAHHPALFAGCAVFMPRAAPPVPRSKLPYCVVTGAADEAAARGAARRGASALANGGMDVLAREVPGMGHAVPGGEEHRRVLEWFEGKAPAAAGAEAVDRYLEAGRFLDASLACAALMERPESQAVARTQLRRIEAAGMVALGSVEVAFANRKYADACLRCREAAVQFAWMPVGEKIRKRLAELESDARVKRALSAED
jgi:poly(3-hydroxybutyrate) depolymerase